MNRTALSLVIVSISCLTSGCGNQSPLRLDLEFAERDISGAPQTLTTFQPNAAGKTVLVRLVMTDAYPFEIDRPHYELYEPECTLSVVRGGDGQSIVAQTTTIDLVNQPMFKTAPLTDDEKKRYKNGFSRGSTGQMTIEFTPSDTGTYRVGFKGPEKGFKRYELHIEQKTQ